MYPVVSCNTMVLEYGNVLFIILFMAKKYVDIHLPLFIQHKFFLKFFFIESNLQMKAQHMH